MRDIRRKAGGGRHAFLQLVGHLDQRFRQFADLVAAARQTLHARRQIAAAAQIVRLGRQIGNRRGDRPRQPHAERDGDQRDDAEQLDKDHIDVGNLGLDLAAADADHQCPAHQPQILNRHRHGQYKPAAHILSELACRLTGKRHHHLVIIGGVLPAWFAIDRKRPVRADHAGSAAHHELEIVRGPRPGILRGTPAQPHRPAGPGPRRIGKKPAVMTKDAGA